MADYLHGYSKDEQDRLYEQARFLQSTVYERVDFSDRKNLLEIGSGVGAQTEILSQRYPHLQITCVDTSKEQLDRANAHLDSEIKEGRIKLIQSDGGKLPFENDTFDSIFVCWLLEHVPDPAAVLREANRVLKSGGVIYCTEVLNSTLFLHPYSPATLRYWMSFNDHQWNIKGDPFVGAKLGNYLRETGFQNIETYNRTFHYDNRMPKIRAKMIDYWTRLLLSGTPSLLAAGRTSQAEINEMTLELEKLKTASDSVFFYTSIQAKAFVY